MAVRPKEQAKHVTPSSRRSALYESPGQVLCEVRAFLYRHRPIKSSQAVHRSALPKGNA